MDLSGWIPPEAWAILIMALIILGFVAYETVPWLSHHISIGWR